MHPCETTYIYNDTENFEHEGYKHTNSNKDNQGMWRGRCISMFTTGELWFTTILWRTPKRDESLTFSYINPTHEVGTQSLEVGLKVTSKPSQTFLEHKSTTWNLPVTLAHPGSPINAIATSIWKNLRGVMICLPQILDLIEGFRSIENQKKSYGCEQESQDLI
jgi:hypothetical protein